MNSTVNHHARTLAVCGALFCAFGTAQANPPPEPKTQFAGKVTSSIDPKNGDVKVCFKEIGVKNKAVTYTAKAEVVASYACRNPGGNCPPGKDTIVKKTVATSATYAPDKYHTVSACITLKVPKPDKNPCPGPMALVLESVSWSNISITDVTNMIGPVSAYPSKQSVNFGSCPAPK
ncbi:hypothetical protein IV454_20230 [Massilia antarctica]|uniref:Uncharacterized protein n=1 Tax=Massilia antarctica TaxID=2765360 RepID=A0AA48W824_9BURK|nr:hypothetical protein [Massilia antarctica]QPI47888.1 hypothetical protein IV454_20230 [Massilia antarctica]